MCEDVPGITTPPQSPPDSNAVPATQKSVPVTSAHMATSNASSFQLNISAAPIPAQQQQKKTTSITSNEALSKGYCGIYIPYCTLTC